MSDRLEEKFRKKYYFKNFLNLIQIRSSLNFFFIMNNITINITIDITMNKQNACSPLLYY